MYTQERDLSKEKAILYCEGYQLRFQSLNTD